MLANNNDPAAAGGIGEASSQPEPDPTECTLPAAARLQGRRNRLVVSTATRLLPLVELLETIQPHVASESIFHAKRKKINAQIALAYVQLRSEHPRHKALTQAFKTMGDIVREETREMGKEGAKDAAKEVVLATIKNAPALISAAHQAGLLS